MDLLENVAEELEFDFQLYVVADGLFGSKTMSDNKESKWSGIVGDLVSGAAHMSFSALSVSSSRYVNNGASYKLIAKCRKDLSFFFSYSIELIFEI